MSQVIQIDCGVGVRELSRHVGITHAHASLILRGLRTPSPRVAERIARHMGISIDALYKKVWHAQEQQRTAAVG
jgi:transcriptional regulator with XRE-family HTH domain